MRRILLFALIAAAAIVGDGCATALNMQDAAKHKLYGGFTMPLTEFSGGEPQGEYSACVCCPFWLVDKPLSLIADTIALPYLLWLQRDEGPPPHGPSAKSVPSP